MTHRADWLALTLITLAVIAFFMPVLFGGGWLPNGGGDLVSFLWPTYTFAARSLPGELPLWNPHQYGGAPFWADNQSGVLYPPLLLTFLLTDAPSYQWLEFLVMAHVWLAGVGMYACLRLIRQDEARLGPAPAALGAVAWMLSDVFVTHQGNLNLIAVAAWLPLVFLGTWRALQAASGRRQAASETNMAADWNPPLNSRNESKKESVKIGLIRLIRFPLEFPLSPNARWIALAGVSFGVGTLAGHAQMTYFTALVVAAAGVWHLARAVGTRHAVSLQVIGTLLLIALIAFGLSAAALLPALEMTGYTARAGLSYGEAARYSVPPQALIGLVAPGIYGRGPAAFSGDWDRVEVGYMGLIALALAGWGAVRGIQRRDGLALFLLMVAILAFLLALGEHFPLHRLAYDLLPGFKSLRVPARFVLLFNFAGAALAALALPTANPHPGPPPQAGEGGVRSGRSPSLCTERGSGGEVSTRRINWAWPLAILVAAELIAFGAGIEVQYDDPRTGYEHPDAVEWLLTQPDAPFRIEGATPRWQPDLAALRGGALYDVYGISNPLALAAYDAWFWGVDHRGSPPYNFLGAKYVIAAEEPPADATFIPVYQAASGMTIYLNTNALPLAHLVYRAVPVQAPEDAWAATHAPDWDPRAVVYVEGGPPLDSEPPRDESSPGGTLFFTRYDANFLAVVVDTPAPAYLVLSEVFYPGWGATLDGGGVPIYRANTAFRAVYIAEPGEHTVVLAFRPLSVAVGLAITAGTGIGLVGVGAVALRRRSQVV